MRQRKTTSAGAIICIAQLRKISVTGYYQPPPGIFVKKIRTQQSSGWKLGWKGGLVVA